ncbi:polyubiquitin-binding protein [Grosmannia clavigera kw1407]|uniref:Polyubiquitin-binding protein n=1 Tax=Grosmannia clavigera (strain kw1407 / UAMH 11150) TaxID=655863 RepID=F0XB07_GROCL|nr:polyubiquitin-binding protein [Grosmannia clavigera kw1407]EFX05187.1 polyubiquitin-binding protein [Grosmannia clavigera kw1407]
MADNNGDFQLSASLAGHDKDVRAVCFPAPGSVFTASRDCTVQAWHESVASPPTYSATLLAQAPYSFNSLAYLPPSEARPQHPHGLVLAGSQGHTIEVRQPESNVSEPRVALLSGHGSNVSTIDVSPSGDFVVSGDWDGRVKLWSTETWELQLDLPGPDLSDKQRAIWAVLAYSDNIVVTGSADHVIRGYTLQGSHNGGELRAGVVIRTPDVVRALSRVRKHAGGAKIASAGNDFLIRLWQFNGTEVGVLHGHDSFIYALDSLPTGELVSSSEDRTVRIWRDTSCIQTITHPALSIWSVSVCQQTGDFATGASDSVARIFTRSRDRIAAPVVLQEFREAVQHSAIPQQQVGDVNASTLPGPDFIETKSGTKEGQTVMINSGGGNISVYQWSNQWLLVGTVVDSSATEAESAADNTFTLDMAPPAGETPPKPSISHPLGTQAVFATLLQSNFAPVLKRINTVNSTLSDGSTLDADQLAKLDHLVQTLSKEVPQIPAAVPATARPTTKTFDLDADSVTLVLRLATTWPYKDRLPSLDLLRCMAASPSVAEFSDGEGHSVLDALLPSILAFPADAKTGLPQDAKAAENNSMMVLRLLTNLFVTAAGQQLVAKNAERAVGFLSDVLDCSGHKNRNLMVALASAASNMAAFALREHEATSQSAFGGDTLARLIKVLAVPVLDLADGEVVYRSLVALGNLASIPGGDYAHRLRTAGAKSWISAATDKIKEERIGSIGETILQLL